MMLPTEGASLVAQTVKCLPAMWETRVRSLGGEDPLEKEMVNPLQYLCLENPMDRGAWYATVRGVAKSWTRPSDLKKKKKKGSESGHDLQATISSFEIEDHIRPTEINCFHHYHLGPPLFPIWYKSPLHLAQILFVRVCSVRSDSVTPWTVAHQALLFIEFSSGLSFFTPRNLSNLGTEPPSLASPVRYHSCHSNYLEPISLDPLKLQIKKQRK